MCQYQEPGALAHHSPGDGGWHTLRVEFQGNHFTVIFDGEKVIEATDDSFSEARNVGVWTKADSTTLFDDFSYASARQAT
jgi:imidazolonepropionase-like amidohydrolase